MYLFKAVIYLYFTFYVFFVFSSLVIVEYYTAVIGEVESYILFGIILCINAYFAYPLVSLYSVTPKVHKPTEVD